MILNRTLQKEILEKLRDQYGDPGGVILSELIFSNHPEVTQNLGPNAAYLGEHGLLTYSDNSPANNGSWYVSELPVRITAKGLDFLEQDGGLSAILGTVTVKLHADTIRDMLKAKIISSQLPREEKKRFIDTLKELPGEALKTVTNKLVEKACENPQAVINVLTGFMS